MKKAQIVLVTLVLFSSVGAVLAFKVQKFNGEFFCTSIQGAACARDANGDYIRFLYAPQVGSASYCSFDYTGCSIIGSTINVVVDPR